MDYTQISIIKRDGKTEPFSLDKIVRAITKAFRAGGITDEGQAVEQIASDVAAAITKAEISVEEIQDMVEERLMKRNPSIAKRYIIYREWRNVERDRRSSIKGVMDGIVTVEKNDINLSNANMSSHTPAGQMMTFASEITKDYALKYLVGVRHGRAHRDGDIHIHDLDYYPTKTTTCIQYDLGDIYERGFSTKNGSVRTPQSIQSYATLATIVFQTNQNEQHGGQSIPAFDHFMAPGVLKTFRRHLTDMTLFLCGVRGGVTLERAELKALVAEHVPTIEPCETAVGRLFAALRQSGVEVADEDIRRIWRQAYDTTRRETHQAMEGFIHNLNTMHSRGGNQVVFSSVNYGTDFSPEGRMVIRELLSATIEGLGHGEVPVFPIQIFKVKDGVSYSEKDFEKAMKAENIEEAIRRKMFFDRHYSKIHFYGVAELVKKWGADIVMINGQNSDAILSFGPSETKLTSYLKRYLLYGNSHFVKSLLEEGVYSAFTSPTTSLVYLFILAIFIGADDEIWASIRMCLPFLIVGYICLLGYEYVTLVSRYGIVVVGNSSLIYYYVSLFWCSTIYLTDRILQKKNIGLRQILLMGFNIVFAVIINSRSWIIQSCLVAVVIYLFGTTQRNIRTKVLRLLLLLLGGYIILQLLNNYFSMNLIFLSDKLGRDSRSHQYTDIVAASSFLGWLFGNGAGAVYYDSTQGYISNIDNQYVFVAFHYGLIVLLQWLGPQLVTLFSVVKTGTVRLIAILPLVCWFMALGGLSVFNVVYCDVKQLMLVLYMGHILSLNNHGGYADE